MNKIEAFSLSIHAAAFIVMNARNAFLISIFHINLRLNQKYEARYQVDQI